MESAWWAAPAGQAGGQGDVLGLGDGGADRLGGGHHRFAVVLLAQRGAHFAQHAADEAIGKNGLQPVAHLHAAAAVADGEQQHDAFVLAFLPMPQARKMCVGHVVDRLVLRGRDGTQRDLRAGRLLDGGAVGLELRFAVGIDSPAKSLT